MILGERLERLELAVSASPDASNAEPLEREVTTLTRLSQFSKAVIEIGTSRGEAAVAVGQLRPDGVAYRPGMFQSDDGPEEGRCTLREPA